MFALSGITFFEKEEHMNSFVNSLKAAVEKRAEFNRTYHELRFMRRETAIDLGLFPEDAYQTAHRTVYGR